MGVPTRRSQDCSAPHEYLGKSSMCYALNPPVGLMTSKRFLFMVSLKQEARLPYPRQPGCLLRSVAFRPCFSTSLALSYFKLFLVNFIKKFRTKSMEPCGIKEVIKYWIRNLLECISATILRIYKEMHRNNSSLPGARMAERFSILLRFE